MMNSKVKQTPSELKSTESISSDSSSKLKSGGGAEEEEVVSKRTTAAADAVKKAHILIQFCGS